MNWGPTDDTLLSGEKSTSSRELHSDRNCSPTAVTLDSGARLNLQRLKHPAKNDPWIVVIVVRGDRFSGVLSQLVNTRL